MTTVQQFIASKHQSKNSSSDLQVSIVQWIFSSGQTEGWKDGQINEKTFGEELDGQSDSRTDGRTDKRTDRRTDGQTDRQTDRRTDRQGQV